MNTYPIEKQANVRNIVRASGHSPLWAFLGDAPQVFVSVSNIGYPQTRQHYQLEDDGQTLKDLGHMPFHGKIWRHLCALDREPIIDQRNNFFHVYLRELVSLLGCLWEYG